MMKRKIMGLVLALCLIMIVPAAFAETLTIDIKSDADFGSVEAMANAKAYDKVVLKIYGEVTLNQGLLFNNTKNVEIIGQGTDAKITLVDDPAHVAIKQSGGKPYGNPYQFNNQPTGFSIASTKNGENYPVSGSVFSISNLTFVNKKSGPNDVYPTGHSGRSRYLTYAYATDANYSNVNFEGGAAVSHNATFTDCAFTTDDSIEFCVFIDNEWSKVGEDYSVSFKNSKFTPESTAYGAVKGANNNGTLTITVDNCVFEDVPNKPALDCDKNITLMVTNSEFYGCANGAYGVDSGTINGVAVANMSIEEFLKAGNIIAAQRPVAAVPDTSKLPQTGDSSSIALWLAVLAMSAAAMTMTIRSRKYN